MAAADSTATGDGVGIETEEDLVARHKKERKDLQSQIQKLKHSIPKGDKKKKKEVTEQIAKLEADLNAKQDQETALLTAKQQDEEICIEDKKEPSKEQQETVEDPEEQLSSTDTQNAGKKSKAQKRRDKKQAKGKEREERIKEQEIENKQGPRHQEMNKIKALLKLRGLALYEIPADGNCMYNAIAHQLSSRNRETSNEELRQKTADYMRTHSDDILPFLTHPDTGDMLSPEEFEKYCDKTAKMPVWGGQVELRALSEALRVPIEVLQADTQPLVIGENIEGKPVTLVYHRHVFRLGEHYNSVITATQNDEKEDEDDDGLK